jgi:hypothetical protein
MQDFIDSPPSCQLKQLEFSHCLWIGREGRRVTRARLREQLEQALIDHDNWTKWTTLCQWMASLSNLEAVKIDLVVFDHEIAYMVDNTLANHPKIQKIYFYCEACRQLTHEAFARALTAETSSLSDRLTELEIDYGVSDQENASQGLLQFFQAIRQARKLCKLGVRDYDISEQQMAALVDSLRCLPSIDYLEISWCGITSESVRYLCREGLKDDKIPSLRTLKLFHCNSRCSYPHLPNIDEELSRELLEALKSNTSLTSAQIGNFTTTTKDHRYYLDLNRSVRCPLKQYMLVTSANPSGNQRRPVPWHLLLSHYFEYDAENTTAGRYVQARGPYFSRDGLRPLDIAYYLLRSGLLLKDSQEVPSTKANPM